MRWNLNWERYQQGGEVSNTTEQGGNTPHSQIDAEIAESEQYIPISKLQNLIELTGMPLHEASQIMSMVDNKNGFDSDMITKDDMVQIADIKKVITELIGSGKIDEIIKNFEGGGPTPPNTMAANEVSANAPKPNPMVRGFQGGGPVKPQYPAFNMTPSVVPGVNKNKPQGPIKPPGGMPNIPKVSPTENLGVPPNEAIASAGKSKYRPKKTTPIGVPNPKQPFNPFSQEMNTLV